MYMSYCKGCVAVELEKTGATASTLTQDTAAFKAACQAVGNTRGEKHAWIAHILGGKTPCPYASAEATAEATLRKREPALRRSGNGPNPTLHLPMSRNPAEEETVDVDRSDIP
ncbi:hypothetical protein B0H10DRAFT_1967262 [Mycena sp. CBHHK59/15]|nr:hypothetical protein B0H10DRAFT_1967262 [Mycena sp. CBHHK59/15]